MTLLRTCLDALLATLGIRPEQPQPEPPIPLDEPCECEPTKPSATEHEEQKR